MSDLKHRDIRLQQLSAELCRNSADVNWKNNDLDVNFEVWLISQGHGNKIERWKR